MKGRLSVSFFLIVFFQGICFTQPAGYGYGKVVTIQSAQVMGNLNNFPLLVSLTDPNLKSVANGGQVQSNSGYDIVFTKDDCTTLLSHQIEKYNPETGEYVAWVKVPSLSTVFDTKLGMFYGKSGATDPSTSSTWPASYKAIWHFSNNSFADATANNNNGTNSGTTNAAGKIGDGRSFSGTNEITVINSAGINLNADFTLEVWIRRTSNTSNHGILGKGANGYVLGVDWPQGGADNLNLWLNFPPPGPGYQLYHTGPISLNTWQHVAATFDGEFVRLYIDGVLDYTNSNVPASTFLADNGLLRIGNGNGSGKWVGQLDEVRISSTVRSTNWIATQFNNQSNPGAFYTVGAQTNAPGVCALLPVEWTSFEATPTESGSIRLHWTTLSETLNAGFEVQRSPDAARWAALGFVPAAGTGSYQFVDDKPLPGTNYYRLRQTDLDGAFSYSPIRLVDMPNNLALNIFPNPATDRITIRAEEAWQTGTVRLSLLDQAVWSAQLPEETNQCEITLPVLPAGVYVLYLALDGKQHTQKLIVR